MSADHNVLLIEDNPADARLLRELLAGAPIDAPGCRLIWEQDLAAGLNRLREGDIDIVLLDLGLPGSAGIETVKELFRLAPRTPTLIVLSGLSDEDVAVQALQAGAQDYLIKGQIDAALLARAMRYARGRAQADEALRDAGRQIEAALQHAERASQAKSRLLATVSHDLRTPLSGILGFAQLLQADPTLDPAQRHGVDTIHHSGEHLLALINDILDLAKIESGRFELSPQPLDLRASVQVVMDIVGVKARAKRGLQLHAEFADDVPAAVLADERRLRRVLLNLLDNAVKFTPSGPVVLRVGWALPGRLSVEVVDSAQRLQPAQAARLFQPFEQAGDAHSRSEGTGLGLSICRQLVRLMGGEIELDAAPVGGNRFRFTIDAAPLPQAARVAHATCPSAA
jgi:signal transduction histidine kinase